MSVLETLHSVFGFDDFRPGQAEIVEALVAKRDVLAVMPTGAGKSLCYQLPALLGDGITIVISPLIALIDNQLAQLKTLGAAAGAIHSGRERYESVNDWRAAQEGSLKLLYMSPERLMTPRMMSALNSINVERFIVDEAHCVSQWGHDFRPDYFALAQLKEKFPDIPIAAFTATADERTRDDIVSRLLRKKPIVKVHGFNRPNIEIEIRDKDKPKDQLIDLLDDHKNQQGIIYCLSRKETEEVADFLSAKGFCAQAYHAGLDHETRNERLNRFLTDPELIIVATIAFGMGIDKPDIRFVFHYCVPASIEAWYQEIGRAGRDGEPARAIMLYSTSDAARRRRMIEMGAPNAASADHKRLDDLLAICERNACRRQALLSHFGEDSPPCNHCDICLTPPEMIDARHEAGLVLQTIAQTGQLYGANFIIDILRGSQAQKIIDKRGDQCTTYEEGKMHNVTTWRTIIRNMTSDGLLHVDPEYGSLQLTALSRDSAVTPNFTMRKQVIAKRSRTKKATPTIDPHSRILLAALKAHRFNLAKERNVPAYVIFTDKTLIDMAHKRPGSKSEFKSIFGVGEAKVRDFSDSFLKIIEQSDLDMAG